MHTVQTAKCCMLHGSLHSNNHNCTHYAPLLLAPAVTPAARASRRGAITACALPVAAPGLVLRHSRAADSPRKTHPRHREGCAASRWSGPCEGSEDCGRASPGPPPRASAAKLVFALMMSASYVRCVCKQAEGQPHTPAQCDRHIVLSLTHHAMLQGGLETLRVADDLWTKREERGTNVSFVQASEVHSIRCSWSQSLSPTQSLRLAPLPLTDDIIHPSFPLPCMELPVLTLQRRTWNMPYFGLKVG